jgi:hypothetical protein
MNIQCGILCYIIRIFYLRPRKQDGRLEGWNNGRLEYWKTGILEDLIFYSFSNLAAIFPIVQKSIIPHDSYLTLLSAIHHL